jgi:anhydro-N-acetylmuramic acid kinase
MTDTIPGFTRRRIQAGDITLSVQEAGQGAPLIPLYHAAMMAGRKKPLAVLNLGGVANITYVGVDGEITAFDTGPANALLDDFVKLRTGADFDASGALAGKGRADAKILKAFLADEYFKKPAPKSLDRNHWSIEFVKDLSTEDGAATLLAMTLGGLEHAFRQLPAKPKALYVAGGGRKNAYLMSVLPKHVKLGFLGKVATIEAAGWNGDATEAEGFAYLAVRSMLGLPLSLPSTTGVSAPITGGIYHRAA